MRRNEYPRPQLVRKDWLNLNGEWDFAFDEENQGLKELWYKNSYDLDKTIEVPFTFQSKLSGLEDKRPTEVVWYKRTFALAENLGEDRLILHFGAVDFEAKVFINGQLVGEHVGGSTPFSFDITNLVDESLDLQTITLRAYDPRYDQTIPRGKQTWHEESHSIWYTNTTGIWQSVWLERVPKTYIKSVFYDTDIDNGQVKLRVHLNKFLEGLKLEYKILNKGETIASGSFNPRSTSDEITVELFQRDINRKVFHGHFLWSPENPNLLDVEIRLTKDGTSLDEIESYFGMRKVHTENGMLFLNNRPYYLRLALDQGYWPESIMTAPDDEAFKKDIELAKGLGFNGVRKHQKVEDPLFMHWADKIGFLVWGESASAQYFSEKTVDLISQEWKEIVERDYNHPSIIAWVPFNESWGVNDISRNKQEQHFTQALYHLIHALDTTRLVISNDGWEHTKSDIVSVHNYSHGQIEEERKFARFKKDTDELEGILASVAADRGVFAEGFGYEGQPIMMTEFGGVGFKFGEQEGWGYTNAKSVDEFVAEYKRIAEVLLDSSSISGFCYTQLYDVEQEINGLLTYDRQPKCDMDEIKKINEAFASKRVRLP